MQLKTTQNVQFIKLALSFKLLYHIDYQTFFFINPQVKHLFSPKLLEMCIRNSHEAVSLTKLLYSNH